MRALRVVFLAVLCLCLFCACGELSPLDPDHAPDYVDKSVLIALLDELDSIPKTLDQTTVVNAYAAVRDSSSVSQKDVDAAVAVLKELRETILSSTVAFIDSGIARHVREALILWNTLTISTVGIIRNARAIATAYSFMLIVENSKSFERNGTSITTDVSIRAAIADPQSHMFCFVKAKIDWRLDLMLNEWKISHIDIVRNAIVIPSLLMTICH